MVQDLSLPLVGVIGCTGNQGSSVLRALLESGKFRVRGLSRNPLSLKCRDLLKLDLGPKKSLLESDILEFDELKEETYEKALKGLDYLFAMTTPNLLDVEQELRCGKMLTNWCLKLGLKHVVWSSLPNVEKLTKGELKVPHFTMKAKVEEYMLDKGLPFTSVMLGCFLTNLLSSGLWKFTKVGDEWILRLPLSGHCKLPMLDPARETGPAVLNILLNRDLFLNKSIPLYSEELTMHDLHRIMGPNFKYEALNAKKMLALPLELREPAMLPDEMIHMFMFFEKFGYYGGMQGLVNLRKQLKMDYLPVGDYLTKNKSLLLGGL